MFGGPFRLRDRRAVHARRHSTRGRFVLTGGVFALVIGAACWAPLAPTALAPSVPAAPAIPADAGAASGTGLAGTAAPTVVAAVPPAVVPVVPTPLPLVPAAPAVVPTISPSGQAVLDSIRADRSAQWLKNHTETPLRSGPSEDSLVFTRLPQFTLLKQIDSKPGWLLVQYSGDGQTREPGTGWVKASDVGGVDPPTVWLRAIRMSTLWSAWDSSGKRTLDMPPSTLVEVTGADFIQGTRVHVRLPGDGRTVPPSEGWMDGDMVSRALAPSGTDLPWAYPDDLRADVRINVPYRTQLDGSDYASANCGPTVLGMALESFGMNLPPSEVRGQVLTSENFDPTDVDAGSFIWALANVARDHGLQAQGLYQSDGALHRWTTDEIRASVRAGQPVIVQVVYRALPGREESSYYGDHYIIVTGLLGDRFLYNDPIGGAIAHESPGYDRVMTAAQLQRAMRASDTSYAFTAFALTRGSGI